MPKTRKRQTKTLSKIIEEYILEYDVDAFEFLHEVRVGMRAAGRSLADEGIAKNDHELKSTGTLFLGAARGVDRLRQEL